MKTKGRGKMKRLTAVFLTLLLLAVAAAFTGCGGGTQEQGGDGSQERAMSLLVESSKAMAQVKSYRMSGVMEMQASGAGGVDNMDMTVDLQADVQVSGGQLAEHMKMVTSSASMGTMEMDSYIIADTIYQYVPGQGWYKMNFGAYMTQNMGMGMLDSKQLEIMAQMARNARVVAEEGEEVGLSFHLDGEFFEKALRSFSESAAAGGRALPEEWLEQSKETLSGMEADVTIWLRQDSKLVSRMEMESVIAGMADVGDVKQNMQLRIYDYNQDIKVVLPQEAEGAQEISFPSV
jgi:hypothetical protein